jgi:MerR family regulatory protein
MKPWEPLTGGPVGGMLRFESSFCVMADFFTTSEIAQMYGLADSTVRHYRASGRLVPARRTPGGHARYAIADVIATLGSPSAPTPGSPAEPRITGLAGETFAPAGQHDVRSSGPGGMLPAEVAALGVREAAASPARSQGRTRWGGRLMTSRRVAA